MNESTIIERPLRQYNGYTFLRMAIKKVWVSLYPTTL
jgi:hypothetical protein